MFGLFLEHKLILNSAREAHRERVRPNNNSIQCRNGLMDEWRIYNLSNSLSLLFINTSMNIILFHWKLFVVFFYSLFWSFIKFLLFFTFRYRKKPFINMIQQKWCDDDVTKVFLLKFSFEFITWWTMNLELE